MIVKGHGEMVSDEILGGDSQIQRIPVLEVFSEDSQFIFRNSARLIRSIKEDVIPSVSGQIFMLNSEETSLSTFKITYKRVRIGNISYAKIPWMR